MNKTRFLTAFALAALAFAAPMSAQAPAALKVGYINSQLILAQAPGAQQASTQFETELSSMRAALQPLADEIEQLMSQYEAQQLTMTEATRATTEENIFGKQQELEQRAQQLEVQAEQRRAELIQPVMDQISRVIEQIRVEESYHIIFDAAAGAIIAADPDLDLTEEVLRRLGVTPGTAGN